MQVVARALRARAQCRGVDLRVASRTLVRVRAQPRRLERHPASIRRESRPPMTRVISSATAQTPTQGASRRRPLVLPVVYFTPARYTPTRCPVARESFTRAACTALPHHSDHEFQWWSSESATPACVIGNERKERKIFQLYYTRPSYAEGKGRAVRRALLRQRGTRTRGGAPCAGAFLHGTFLHGTQTLRARCSLHRRGGP